MQCLNCRSMEGWLPGSLSNCPSNSLSDTTLSAFQVSPVALTSCSFLTIQTLNYCITKHSKGFYLRTMYRSYRYPGHQTTYDHHHDHHHDHSTSNNHHHSTHYHHNETTESLRARERAQGLECCCSALFDTWRSTCRCYQRWSTARSCFISDKPRR